jgi:uncharacterized membrane protein
VFLVCALLGVGISVYLTTVHYQHVPLICSSQGLIDCAHVLSSPYSVVPGTSIPISVPGLGWCVVSAILAVAVLYFGLEQRRLLWVQFAWSLLGMLTVLYLVYVEIVRLHALCIWCTILHGLILIMFLITIFYLQRARSELELETEDEEPLMTTTPR